MLRGEEESLTNSRKNGSTATGQDESPVSTQQTLPTTTSDSAAARIHCHPDSSLEMK